MRLVDVDKSKSYFEDHLDDNGVVAAMNAIEEMPIVDAEPVRHGRWYYGECSVCKGICIHYKPPYCPNCGAKMDAEVEG